MQGLPASVDPRMMRGTERHELWFQSPLPIFSALTTTGATAYGVYVGRTPRACTLTYVEMFLSSVGSGAQTAEVAITSVPAYPQGAGQTHTKLAATGTLDDLTSGATVKRNTASFAYACAAGVHLFAWFRGDMAGTEATLSSLSGDFAQGLIQTATPGALTGVSSWSGALVTAARAVAQAPDLRIRAY